MRYAPKFRPRLAACLSVAVALGASGFLGCDDSSNKTGPVEDTAKHGEATTKNMEDFMKNKPPAAKEAPKAQTK